MVGLNTMSNSDAIPDIYASQLASFQRSDQAREQFINDLIEKYEMLLGDHETLKQDYTSEQHIRRNYQRDNAKKDSQLSALDNSSFVLCLIDGDGVIFQDMLLAAAAHGGSEAASKLQHALREHISALYPSSGHWPIMVHMYLSLDKLGQKLAQVGLLKHPQEFRAFVQSFNVGQPLFSIIDVGQGKERADYKIKETLRTFVENPTCKHIVFGGCHDAGYLLNLDQYRHNFEKSARFTLLESTTPQKGFADLLYFKRARFDDIFRSAPLPENIQSAYVHSQLQAPFSPSVTAAPLRTATNRSMSPVTSPVQAVMNPAPPTAVGNGFPSLSAASSSPAGPPTPRESSPEQSWAAVGKTGPINGKVSIAPKNAPKKQYVYYNKAGQRLDEPLPRRDQNAVLAIEDRMKKTNKNLCNQWHLSKGKCDKGKFCPFQHEPKLTPAETIALRYKARSLACKHRPCENFDCYLGHQCTFERDQGYCDYPDTCHLRSSHGMDKVRYERWDEDENVEYA